MKVFLIVYQNPRTSEWYWLTFARTRHAADAMRTAHWGSNPVITSMVWEGMLDVTSPTFSLECFHEAA